jgi:hypothetical protein
MYALEGLPVSMSTANDFEYERGRQFATVAPVSMPLRINGKLNPKAIALLKAAFARRYLLP